MKCQILFSGEKLENITNLSLLNLPKEWYRLSHYVHGKTTLGILNVTVIRRLLLLRGTRNQQWKFLSTVNISPNGNVVQQKLVYQVSARTRTLFSNIKIIAPVSNYGLWQKVGLYHMYVPAMQGFKQSSAGRKVIVPVIIPQKWVGWRVWFPNDWCINVILCIHYICEARFQ